MAELQSFADAVPVQETLAPLDESFSPGRAIARAAGDLVGFKQAADAKKADADKAAADQVGANLAIELQRMGMRDEVEAAVEAGQLTPEEAKFEGDFKAQLESLEKARGKGLNGKIAQGIKRSLLFQQAATLYPHRVEQYAKLAGVALPVTGAGNLDTEEDIANKQLADAAQRAVALGQEYGVAFSGTPQEILDAAAATNIPKFEAERRSLEQKAARDAAAKAANSQPVAEWLNKVLTDDLTALNEDFATIVANPDMNRAAVQQVMRAKMADRRAELAALYPGQPELVDAHMQRLQEHFDGHIGLMDGSQRARDESIDKATWERTNLRAIEYKMAQLGLEDKEFQVGMNPVEAAQRAANLKSRTIEIAYELSKADLDPALRTALDGIPDLGTDMAVMFTGLQTEASDAVTNYLFPEKGARRNVVKRFNAAVQTLIRKPELFSEDPQLARTVMGGLATWLEGEARPSEKRAVVQAVFANAHKPEFRELVKQSPHMVELAAEAAEELENQVVEGLRGINERMVKDRVSMFGRDATAIPTLTLYRRLGSYVVPDPESLDNGIPQLMLNPGTEIRMSAAGKAALQRELDGYNTELYYQAPKFQMLADIQGHGNVGLAWQNVTSDLELGNLAPGQAPLQPSLGSRIRDRVDSLLTRAMDPSFEGAENLAAEVEALRGDLKALEAEELGGRTFDDIAAERGTR